MTLTLGPAAELGGRYRLIERIAAGGQGEVWRAEDTALGRTVALKVLRGEYAENVEFRDRFRREARHAAALSHPGVAQVFDYDEGQGGTPPYLVMEYVEGESLSATIARDAPLDPDRVLEVVVAAASALAVAHAAGLVHRDVKPGNLLVGRDGSIKITDFGISRAVDAVPLTRTGVLMGTPLYLAPEQASGLPATASCDLYALGVIAYEMLTGHPPFEGPPTAVLLAHRDTPLPPLPSSVPAGLRDLVTDLTAKQPSARPADAATLAIRAHDLRADPAIIGPSSGTAGVPHPPHGTEARSSSGTAGVPQPSYGAEGSSGAEEQPPSGAGGVRPSYGVQPGRYAPSGGAGPFAAAAGAADRTTVGGPTPHGTVPHGAAYAGAGGPPRADRTQVMEHPLASKAPRRGRVGPLVVGGLAIAALAGIVGWFARPSSPERPVVPPPAASPQVSQPPTPFTHRPTPHRVPPHPPAERKLDGKGGHGHDKHGGGGKHHH